MITNVEEFLNLFSSYMEGTIFLKYSKV